MARRAPFCWLVACFDIDSSLVDRLIILVSGKRISEDRCSEGIGLRLFSSKIYTRAHELRRAAEGELRQQKES
jgi:hypothetical protein